MASKQAHFINKALPPLVKKKKKKFHLDPKDFGCICTGANSMGSYKRDSRSLYFTCLLQTYCHLSTNEKVSIS